LGPCGGYIWGIETQRRPTGHSESEALVRKSTLAEAWETEVVLIVRRRCVVTAS
jgi:hypothetical protein